MSCSDNFEERRKADEYIMAEILFEDILSHYYLKTKQALDEIENIKRTAQIINETSDACWRGSSGSAFIEKNIQMIHELDNTILELTEALRTITTISSV